MYMETLNGDYDYKSHAVLVFQWQKEIKSINTCWFRPSNNMETSGRFIHI